MTETGKPVIIPTSSGALATEEWRLDDEAARAKRQAEYDANAAACAEMIARAKAPSAHTRAAEFLNSIQDGSPEDDSRIWFDNATPEQRLAAFIKLDVAQEKAEREAKGE